MSSPCPLLNYCNYIYNTYQSCIYDAVIVDATLKPIKR